MPRQPSVRKSSRSSPRPPGNSPQPLGSGSILPATSSSAQPSHDRPIVCELCGKKVSNVGVLRRHMGLHSSAKQEILFPCRWTYCQYATLEAIDMLVHYRAHIDAGEPPYGCTIGAIGSCKFRSWTPDSLAVHIKETHDGPDPSPAPKRDNKGKGKVTSKKATSRHAPYARPTDSTTATSTVPSQRPGKSRQEPVASGSKLPAVKQSWATPTLPSHPGFMSGHEVVATRPSISGPALPVSSPVDLQKKPKSKGKEKGKGKEKENQTDVRYNPYVRPSSSRKVVATQSFVSTPTASPVAHSFNLTVPSFSEPPASYTVQSSSSSSMPSRSSSAPGGELYWAPAPNQKTPELSWQGQATPSSGSEGLPTPYEELFNVPLFSFSDLAKLAASEGYTFPSSPSSPSGFSSCMDPSNVSAEFSNVSALPAIQGWQQPPAVQGSSVSQFGIGYPAQNAPLGQEFPSQTTSNPPVPGPSMTQFDTGYSLQNAPLAHGSYIYESYTPSYTPAPACGPSTSQSETGYPARNPPLPQKFYTAPASARSPESYTPSYPTSTPAPAQSLDVAQSGVQYSLVNAPLADETTWKATGLFRDPTSGNVMLTSTASYSHSDTWNLPGASHSISASPDFACEDRDFSAESQWLADLKIPRF